MTKGNNTRENIIIKSAQLFNLYGYHRCSVNDIMEATKLKKGGIYNHFKNKNEIAIASFEYSFHRIFQRFRERLDLCTSASEKLLTIIKTFEDNFQDPLFEGGCPIINTAIDTTDTYPLLREKAKLALAKLESYIAIKLKEGILSKEFNEEISPEEIAAYIISTFEGAIIVSRLNANDKYVRIALKNISNYIAREVIRK